MPTLLSYYHHPTIIRTDYSSTQSDGSRPLIITHDGASGVFPGSTDLAYQQAVKDGADIIDCWVRMSKDGVAFCLGSSDLNGSTTAATTFLGKMTNVDEIQNKSGIFSFDLSWNEIQTLKRAGGKNIYSLFLASTDLHELTHVFVQPTLSVHSQNQPWIEILLRRTLANS
jgi:glycerophosphoryl diester phosphodiesterase